MILNIGIASTMFMLFWFQTTNIIFSNLQKTQDIFNKYMFLRAAGGVAELASASKVYPRGPGSSLCTDRKYFLILLVIHLNSNLWGVNS
jgi:hypothetical protein